MKTKRLCAKPIIYSICLLRVLHHVQVKKSTPLDNFSLPRHAQSHARTLSCVLSQHGFFEEKRDCSQSSLNLTFGLKLQVGGIKNVTV